MRSKVRAAWIAVGGVFTALVVVAMAVAVLTDIEVQADGDLVSASSASRPVGPTTEITTYAYEIHTQMIVVRTTGNVEVKLEPGTPGRLSVKRTLTWDEAGRHFEEAWRDGGMLNAEMSCATGCHAEYVLGVPPGVGVMAGGPSELVPCPRPVNTEISCSVPPPGGPRAPTPPRGP
ncbi:hypothetical protein GCM10023194_13220 [Planotetraspora phitsanulokensis]|uniref:Uncharacterized protein n=1 Tax=Planotetraspora phitsanulokensis TaxID=575192 RepID=A0A8J3UAW1_9ACTN|nr:hypothetical protein [Planotetraspora phitsanulokensis]GII41417.1 hypothetical protein Pph01_64200 [Planotetraspora phitsanulokensis]